MLRAMLLFPLLISNLLSLADTTEVVCPETSKDCSTLPIGSNDDGSEHEASDDSVLLQTLHQMAYHKGAAASMPSEDVQRTPEAPDPNLCTGNPYLDLLSYDTRLHITSLPTIGDFTMKRDCSQNMSLIMASTAIAHGSGAVDPATGAYIAVGIFAGLSFLFILYLMRTIVFPGSNTEIYLDEQAKNRAETTMWQRNKISWLLMSWVDVWVAHWGSRVDVTKINPAQLGPMPTEEDESRRLGVIFDRLWKEQAPKKSDYDLVWVVIRFTGWPRLMAMGTLCLIYQSMLFIFPALAIQRVVVAVRTSHLHYANDPHSFGAADCFAPSVEVLLMFFGGGIVLYACDSLAFMMMNRLNNNVRSGLTSLCFEKSQRLHGALTEFHVPSIAGQPPVQYSFVALINNDIQNAMNGAMITLFNTIFFVPIFIVLFFLSIQTLHKAFMFTVAGQILMIAGIFVAARGQALRLKTATDTHGLRVSLCHEIFQGVRLIKAYAWEVASLRMLNRIRKMELDAMHLLYKWIGGFFFLVLNVPRVMTMFSLGGYVLFYGNIDAVTIFTMLQILRSYNSALRTLSDSIPTVARIYPSIVRLQIFLHLPDSAKWARMQQPPSAKKIEPASTEKPQGDVIVRTKGSFAWQSEMQPFLKNVDVEVRKGELVAIVGEVGSGKTALITAMLGEMFESDNAVLEAPHLVAYHSQVPTIAEGTLRNNVVFWRQWDPERYNEVLSEACLLEDLKYLPGQDGCSIGHKGIALSGGQRARVSLARMAYSKDADLMLIDDPFGSVDMHTASHILEQLILGDALAKKARVVVMQPDLARLQHFGRVIVLANGEIAIQGDLDTVREHPAFVRLLKKNADGTTFNEAKESQSKKPAAKGAGGDAAADGALEKATIRDEEFEGRADWTTIKYFLNLGGNFHFGGFVFSYAVMVVLSTLADVSLAQWGSAELHETHRPTTYLFGYIFWVGMGMLAFIPIWLCGSGWTLNISDKIFETIASNLLGAPIDSFHDRQPLGRVLNRLSSDMLNIDYITFFKIMASVGMIFWYFIPVLYIHTVVPFWFTLCCLPFYTLLFYIVRRYWNVLVPLRYLNSVTRSKLAAYVADAGSMRTTLRAYGVNEEVLDETTKAVDDSMNADMASNISRKWIIVRLGFTYIIFLTTVVLVGIWFPSAMSIGIVGLCTSYSLGIVCELEFTLEAASGAQFELVSMDRIHEYVNLPKEKEAICKDDGKYSCFFVKVKKMELGSLQKVKVGSDDRVQILRKGRTIFEEAEDRKALVLGKGVTWIDVVVDKNAHPELTQGHSWHRLIAVGFLGNDPESMAAALCDNKEPDMTLCLQSDFLSQGARVTVTNLRAGYSQFPDTLKGVSLEILPLQKTAIMGPTGCGKSTFMQCLLRLLEPRYLDSCTTPPIMINNVDTTTLGLRTLRSMLGLVPQDPVLFSGSLRMNLDPFDEHSDDRIWRALCTVRLGVQLMKSAFPRLKLDENDEDTQRNGGLEKGKEENQRRGALGMSVRTEGENFSFGQRQLLCIARMILRQPSVLLLDECTSSIDPLTQQLVTQAIRTAFPRSTQIAIAHRLETIMDFDQVVVFNRGKVHKTGCPKDFQGPNSVQDLLKWATSSDDSSLTSPKILDDEPLGVVHNVGED